MRYAAWILALLTSAAFAQKAPENLASDAFKKRLQSIDLLSLPKLYGRTRTLIAGVVKPPSVCAIPLLRATPSARSEPMPMVLPAVPARQTHRDELLRVPAPACDEFLAKNK